MTLAGFSQRGKLWANVFHVAAIIRGTAGGGMALNRGVTSVVVNAPGNYTVNLAVTVNVNTAIIFLTYSDVSVGASLAPIVSHTNATTLTIYTYNATVLANRDFFLGVFRVV